MHAKYQHFVVTRLALGIYEDARLNKLIDLFEAVTLPSLLNQSNQEFVWLVSIDAAAPETAKSKIEKLLERHSNVHLVPIDVTRLMNVRLACFDWVWDSYQDFILENHLLKNPNDYVITSIIDADDAWHRDVIASVNNSVAERLPQLCEATKNRGTWLRHSSGLAITFPHGYAWFISDNKIWPLQQEFRSMAVFVASRFSSGISACSCRHTKWRQYAEILEFEVVPLTHKQPMWVYSRHEEAVGQWDSNPAMPMPDGYEGRLASLFGIDLAKVKRWCAAYPPQHFGSKDFNQDAAIQFDLFFQIAGLNRKIKALDRRPGMQRVDGSDPIEELKQCEAERERLVAKLRHVNSDT